MFLEKTYLPVINFIYDKTKWMNAKIRKGILVICILIEVLLTYVYQCDEFMGFLCSAMLNSMIGTLCFIGIIITGIDHKIEKVQVKSWLVYLLMLCGIVVFVSGLHHYISYSYMFMGLVMCFLMPGFIIVWVDNINRENMFKMIAWILTICFVIFVILNLILAPVNDPNYSVAGRYFGMAADPNGLAKIAVTACACAIYLTAAQKGIKKILFICILVIAGIITFMTASRTNIIALGLICVAALLFLVKTFIVEKNIKLKRIILGVCIVALVGAAILLGIIFNSNNGGNVGTIGNRLSQGVMEDGSIDLNVVSSGRINIWTYCIEKTNLIGNDMSDGLQNEALGVHHDHAHNTVIELLYRSGMIAGISFLIIELYCIVWGLRRVFSKEKNTNLEIITVLLLIAFVVASVFDIVVLPFAKMTTFLFYMCLPVVFSKKENILDVTDD